MNNRFFGEYLVSKNIIDMNTVEDILHEQRKINKKIGELCINKGYLTEQDVKRILNIQKITDAPFCEIAIQNNLLTQEQVDEILFIQEINNFHIGELLVKKNILTLEQLSNLLDEYSSIEEQRNKKINQEIHKLEDKNIIILIDILKSYFLRKQHVTIKPIEINKKLDNININDTLILKITNNAQINHYYINILGDGPCVLLELQEFLKNYFLHKNILIQVDIEKYYDGLTQKNNIVFCSSNNIQLIIFY